MIPLTKRSHSLQQLLPLCLVAAFLLTAVLAVLFGASVYRDILDRSDRITESTALTYITEKVRQSPGELRLDRIGDCPAMVLRLEGDRTYDTYIYCYDGSLRELMIRREVPPAADMGRPLLPALELDFTLQGDLLQLRLRCPSGEDREAFICLRDREDQP